jgi:hypothetical protein
MLDQVIGKRKEESRYSGNKNAEKIMMQRNVLG